jgi:hypothetical protein
VPFVEGPGLELEAVFQAFRRTLIWFVIRAGIRKARNIDQWEVKKAMQERTVKIQ